MPILGILSAGGLAPLAPTIGTATGFNTAATVAFTAPSWVGKGSGTVTYTATSSPSGITGTATSSPITVTGLTNGTAYTFTVRATTSYGVTGASSAASNSATPVNPAFTVDYLVIAGGGGGGGGYGAGAGAGGYRTSAGTSGRNSAAESAFSLNVSTNYAVSIGGGGGGGASVSGTNGVSSSFNGITSSGGGFGAGPGNQGGGGIAGGTGGCGGGSGYVSGTAGQGTVNQGFNAATGPAGFFGGSGGGGAGGLGLVGAAQADCRGGAGIASDITGTSITRTSGGNGYGAPTATAGGGGAAGQVGTANTGGGGGGANDGPVANGSAGGSGVVILRYPDTRTITIGAGLTGTESAASGGFKRATITAGAGNVSWA